MTSYDYSIYYERYHDNSPQHADRAAASHASWLAALLPANKDARIMDVGCGYGYALLAVRTLGYANISGLELSEQQAEKARLNGLTIDVTGDTAQTLRERPGAYDCVLLLDVLEHVPVAEQIDFLRACASSLKPDGRLILTVPNASAVLSPRWRYNDYTHHSSFTEHSLYFVLKNAGFAFVEVEADRGAKRFPLRFWRRSWKGSLRQWLVRFFWRQVFLSEVPHEDIRTISFELNLRALARVSP
jgi:2-polyprenyl-3-methyl-5-hydroxy-6-metoxy-1,4-benzoquinol methylase